MSSPKIDEKLIIQELNNKTVPPKLPIVPIDIKDQSELENSPLYFQPIELPDKLELYILGKRAHLLGYAKDRQYTMTLSESGKYPHLDVKSVFFDVWDKKEKRLVTEVCGVTSNDADIGFVRYIRFTLVNGEIFHRSEKKIFSSLQTLTSYLRFPVEMVSRLPELGKMRNQAVEINRVLFKRYQEEWCHLLRKDPYLLTNEKLCKTIDEITKEWNEFEKRYGYNTQKSTKTNETVGKKLLHHGQKGSVTAQCPVLER